MSILSDFKGLPRTWFIETGTGEGDTLEHAAREFEYCFSVEQNQELYRAAEHRFESYPNVFVFHGDSAAWLSELMAGESIDGGGCTFWLDAHYCGEPAMRTASFKGRECPLLDELKVLASKPWNTLPTILIDDAHMFTGSWWDSDVAKRFHFDRRAWPTIAEIDAMLPRHRLDMLDNGGILQYTPQSLVNS